MDALDPEDQIDFAAVLYNSTSFDKSVMNALTYDGILVAQLGMLQLFTMKSWLLLYYSTLYLFHHYAKDVALCIRILRMSMVHLPLEVT